MLHARPITPPDAIAPEVAGDGEASARGGRKCPECGQAFKPAQWRQLFCSPKHKSEFHNRQTVRGRVLTPLVMAARQTRGGVTRRQGHRPRRAR